jgi:hypothetical protein
MRIQWQGIALVGAILCLACVSTACVESGRVICDDAAPAATFQGKMIARQGSNATFRIERIGHNRPVAPDAPPVPSVGDNIVVHYWSGSIQYLRIGRRYDVTAWWGGRTEASSEYGSGVHVASDQCSTGTVYAGGSAIDTALVHQPWPRRALFVALLLAIVVGIPRLVRSVRKGRRQRRNTEQLVEARRRAAQRIGAKHE